MMNSCEINDTRKLPLGLTSKTETSSEYSSYAAWPSEEEPSTSESCLARPPCLTVFLFYIAINVFVGALD